MKKLMLLCLILSMLSFVFAEEAANPISLYMEKPNTESFSKAVSYIAENDAKETEGMGMKLTLAFIANNELNRIMELAKTSKLSPGESFTLANLYLSMEKYPEAIAMYDKINTDTPAWSCPWRHKGEALYEMKDYKGSVKALEQAIETNKEHYDAYIWMAKSLYELKKYKAARANIEIALKLDSSSEHGSADEEMTDKDVQDLYEKIKAKTK